MVPLAAARAKHRTAGPCRCCSEGQGAGCQGQREARAGDSPLIRGGDEEGVGPRAAVVADLHDELGDAHADVVQQPEQRVVIRRICQGLQGLRSLARMGPRSLNRLPLRGARLREPRSEHGAGGHSYLGRSSARRSSPWAQSSSTPCGTPGTDPLARAASRKAYLGWGWGAGGGGRQSRPWSGHFWTRSLASSPCPCSHTHQGSWALSLAFKALQALDLACFLAFKSLHQRNPPPGMPFPPDPLLQILLILEAQIRLQNHN